jgi:hypothetical protein
MPSSSDQPSVQDLINEAIDADPTASPGELAELVIGALDPSQYAAALRRTLPQLARNALATYRAQTLAPTPSGSSAKRLALQGYAMTLAQRAQAARGVQLHVGGGAYKQLGECTDRDLLFVVLSRKRAANLLEERAYRYEQLRLAMQDAGAATVAQLDDDVLMETLAGDMVTSEPGSLVADTLTSPDVPSPREPDA